MVAQLKLRCHPVSSVAQEGVMRLIANALGYSRGQSVRTAGMSVGEVAIDSLVKPLGDAADGKCRRGNGVQPCFRAG